MRDYRLYELSDEGFEDIVCYVCAKELGTGTIAFTKGRDGGRDARFEGVAQRYPSLASPWSGKFIIQAKHTSNALASCSDNDFCRNRTSVISREIPRMRSLKQAGEVDNYLLFTNRKLSGDAESLIRSRIRDEAKIDNVGLVGRETFHRMITDHWKDISRIFHLDQLRGPLIFHSQDLMTVITAISGSHVIADVGSDDIPTFIAIEDKNIRNNLSRQYFRHIQTHSLAYFGQIKAFLKNPVNAILASQYCNIVAEFNEKIMVRRDEFERFEQVFEVLYDRLLEYEPQLCTHTRLLYTLLHFMYWNCDLGEK